MKKCIVIGSGLGGLSTGVILAKNGYEVTVFEQAKQIGGCLQCFWRNGVKFETGMHFVGSLDDGEVLSNYFNFLGIKDKVEVSRMDTCSYNTISLNGERFSIANGHEEMIESLGKRFPNEKDNLRRYWQLVDTVAQESPFYDLNRIDRNPQLDLRLFTTSINEVIDEVITDPTLRNVLVGDMSLYAAQRDRTPFSTYAFVSNFYNRSAFRIVGGSDNIAKALAEVIKENGGKIYTGCRVVRALSKNGSVTRVELENGELIEGDVFISDVHPMQLSSMFTGKELRPSFYSRIESIKNTPSVFSLFLKFTPEAMPYMNTNFYGYSCNSPWDMENYDDKSWPRGYLYMHHCHEKEQKFAKSGVILAYMLADELSEWAQTTIGKRGEAYEEFKRTKAEKLLDAVERDFPGLRSYIEEYYTATPLTYRDYTMSPGGSMYGMAKDLTLGLAGRVSYKTKLPNFYLVGQNINAHGILGVLVGTLNVCSALLGEDKVHAQMLEANNLVKSAEQKTVLIIGGGLGGLVTGALLAKEDYKVTVLEKNAIIGGGLQTIRRKGVDFATGMHFFGGFNKGDNLYKIFDYLGIADKLNLMPTDENACDVVTIADDNATYRLPKGKENLVKYLSGIFPDETENIRQYIDKLFELSQEEDLFYMRERSAEPNFTSLSEDFINPYNVLIDKYIHNPKLKRLLYYLKPLFGGEENTTPAFFNALLSVLHIGGTFQFVGSGQQMVDLLKKIIEDKGGSVISNEEVTNIEVEDHLVTKVVTKNGNSYTADSYISDVHPDVLMKIISDNAFPAAFRKRLKLIPESTSSFKVYIKFKEKSFPFLNNANFYYNSNLNWPQGIMYVTPPVENQGEFAKSMAIISLMDYADVKKWENTETGHRGEEYEQWKQKTTEKVLDVMENIYPNFRNFIDFSFASSPLTIRDFLGNKEGSIYGFQKDSRNLMLSQMSVTTKVKNLFLTGQNVNIHGFCGVSLTAIETAEALVGHNTIVKKINEHYNIYK
ncbi:MAG: NAD(P)/FAD-dependent oxidoreductase [Bacteroidales bacterium]|nr:NAD(P)/FAD-dependent oxidoreductase [Bacteroidales bacterium]